MLLSRFEVFLPLGAALFLDSPTLKLFISYFCIGIFTPWFAAKSLASS